LNRKDAKRRFHPRIHTIMPLARLRTGHFDWLRASYWEDLGVAFPKMDEYVEIEAYEVSFSDGTSKLIACSITLADGAITVQLRDDDFVPLWTKKGKR